MSEMASVEVVVFGLVQGVFFRAFTQQQAEVLNLTGYVRNIPGGSVKVFAEGDRDNLEKFLSCLETGPPSSRVEHLETCWKGYSHLFKNFEIKY
jgi:acylphosphatase